MRRICVFCGSALGSRPAYRDAAKRFGSALATRGLGLVYGGGSVGLMGVLADAVLAEGGEVIGVIPGPDRKSTRLNSSHSQISYAVFCLKKKKNDLQIQCLHILLSRWPPQ